MNDQELIHYGVPGMKWGKRKAKYVTVYQAQKKATKAAEQARKESISESRASGPKGLGSFQKANRKALNAKRKAYRDSMAADRAHNKQLRDNKKQVENGKKAVDKMLQRANKIGAKVTDNRNKGNGITIDYNGEKWKIY